MEEERSNATDFESIRYHRQEDQSALSQMASVLQTSPWIVATVACLLYSVVILFILLALVLCKRLVESSSHEDVEQEINSISHTDEEQLINSDDDDEPPSYEEVTQNKSREVA